jgi:nitrogen-specific signal transduction histidine kinase
MKIERRFTEAGKDAYAALSFRKTTSEIRNPDGSVVFQLKDIRGAGQLVAGRLPTSWRRNTSARPACRWR